MNKEPITHLLRMVIPGKQERRNVFLRKQAADFAEGKKPQEHFSPSGLTAILFAEAALQAGKIVLLRIHPQHDVIVSIDTEERPYD